MLRVAVLAVNHKQTEQQEQEAQRLHKGETPANAAAGHRLS